MVGRSLDDLVKAGDEALRAGEWAAAEQHYRGVLESVEAGEALFGLGVARWWSGDTGEALRCWERAYVAFERQSEPGQAVLSAVYLCLAFRMSLGNDAAARGWAARAAELVEEFQLTPMRGWALLCADGCVRSRSGLSLPVTRAPDFTLLDQHDQPTSLA
jgi:hypothetical protein